MKKRQKKLQKKVSRKDILEMRKAINWIEGLTPMELKTIEQLTKVLIAQTLFEIYSKRKKLKSRRDRKGKRK